MLIIYFIAGIKVKKGICVAQLAINLSDIAVDLGDKKLFSGLFLSVHHGEKLTLLGRNGSGKSTLLKIIAGLKAADDGEISRASDLVFCYLAQNPEVGDEKQTLLEYCQNKGAEAWQCQLLLEELGLKEDSLVAHQSGGELRKAALIQVLAANADVLLLDEPTNHLDITTIEWLEEKLKAHKGGLIVISHDRRFAENVTKACLWLDRGVLHKVPVNLNQFETWQSDFFAKEEVERAKFDKMLAEETRWSHQGITARRKRNMGRMRRLQELRKQRSQMINRTGNAKLNIEAAEKSGKEVIVAENLHFTWPDGYQAVKDFNLRLLRKQRIGIVGPNGVGKTTLLKLLIGQLEPSSGILKRGTQLETLWIDQNRSRLDESQSIWDALSPHSDHVIVGGKSRHKASYAEDFLFTSAQLRSPISSLSGGEKNRLSLAIALLQPCNLMILDEPTNDLDLETLDLLEELLSEFDGTLIIVSHDRDFLDRLTDSCLFFEGDGKITSYAGGFSDAIAQGASLKKINGPQKAAKMKKEESGKKEEVKETKKADKPKLSYKHKYGLENLPLEIEKLTQEIALVEQKLADKDLYTKNPDKFQSLSDELTKLQNQKEQKEEELLEIEILLEEME